MKKLFMKIVGYEEQSGSLLVKVASDKTVSQNPDDYAELAYQPAFMFPDISDPEVVKKRIAIAAKYTAEQQALREQLQTDPTRITSFQAMVDSLTEYDVETDPDFNPPVVE
jgi:hypothetical protein